VEGVVIDTNVFVAAGFNSKTEIVAWPAADPSQATGRVKRHDNQLHRARVLQVRIQSPPAVSLQTIGS